MEVIYKGESNSLAWRWQGGREFIRREIHSKNASVVGKKWKNQG